MAGAEVLTYGDDVNQMNCACVDIGTNTTRLLVAERDGGRLRELVAVRRFLRLVPDEGGQIPSEAVAALAAVVAAQCARAPPARRERGARRRDRGDPSCEQPRRAVRGGALGLRHPGRGPRPASGRRGWPSRARRPRWRAAPAGTIGVVDVGGGSSEIVAGTARAASSGASLPIGSGVLTERHVHGDPPTPTSSTRCAPRPTPRSPGRAPRDASSSRRRRQRDLAARGCAATSCRRRALARALASSRRGRRRRRRAPRLARERVRLLPAGLAAARGGRGAWRAAARRRPRRPARGGRPARRLRGGAEWSEREMAKAREIPGLDARMPFAEAAAPTVAVRAEELFEQSENVLDTTTSSASTTCGSRAAGCARCSRSTRRASRGGSSSRCWPRSRRWPTRSARGATRTCCSNSSRSSRPRSRRPPPGVEAFAAPSTTSRQRATRSSRPRSTTPSGRTCAAPPALPPRASPRGRADGLLAAAPAPAGAAQPSPAGDAVAAALAADAQPAPAAVVDPDDVAVHANGDGHDGDTGDPGDAATDGDRKARKVKGLDPEGTLADNAERIVRVAPRRAAVVHPAPLDPAEVVALHDMRIAAKRLRYILEMTAETCFGAVRRDGDQAHEGAAGPARRDPRLRRAAPAGHGAHGGAARRRRRRRSRARPPTRATSTRSAPPGRRTRAHGADSRRSRSTSGAARTAVRALPRDVDAPRARRLPRAAASTPRASGRSRNNALHRTATAAAARPHSIAGGSR